MDEKAQAREKFISGLNKAHGDRSIFQMDDRADLTEIQTITTGSLSLDHAIGVGGFPRGRIVEIYGPEATGKSLLALSSVAKVQENGGYAAFIDAEHALTPAFARLLGVNTKTLDYSQPDSGELALTIMEKMIASSVFDIVVLDSVAALVTEEEMVGNVGDANKPAYTAILMAKALKRMTGIISKTRTVAVFINQLREKPMVLFGSPEYTPGGKALKFYASLRIEVKKKEVEKDANGRPIGHLVNCRIVKNKVAPPFATCQMKLNYTNGIDKNFDIITVALELGIINKASSWYHFGEHKFNGEDALIEALSTNAQFLDTILKAIQEKLHA